MGTEGLTCTIEMILVSTVLAAVGDRPAFIVWSVWNDCGFVCKCIHYHVLVFRSLSYDCCHCNHGVKLSGSLVSFPDCHWYETKASIVVLSCTGVPKV